MGRVRLDRGISRLGLTLETQSYIWAKLAHLVNQAEAKWAFYQLYDFLAIAWTKYHKLTNTWVGCAWPSDFYQLI